MSKLASALTVLLAGGWAAFASVPPTRHLHLTYTCYLTNLPAHAKKVACWIPVPSSDDRQSVELLPLTSSGGRITTESKYGNRMYYRQYQLDGESLSDTLKIVLSYRISLREKSVLEAKQLAALPKVPPAGPLRVYLQDNRLIPLQGPLLQLGQQMQLPDPPILAARQIYDQLIDRMVYNYQAPGAGIGDAVWACNSQTGDCSDYHSVFIGICRSVGIPADHVFGLPLKSNPVKDWHCWARFWVNGPEWITIDASEADKHPQLRDYLFGSLSDGYLTLSHGRDLVLEPAQQGAALNLFADPYVEVDGEAFSGVGWQGVFQEGNKP